MIALHYICLENHKDDSDPTDGLLESCVSVIQNENVAENLLQIGKDLQQDSENYNILIQKAFCNLKTHLFV